MFGEAIAQSTAAREPAATAARRFGLRPCAAYIEAGLGAARMTWRAIPSTLPVSVLTFYTLRQSGSPTLGREAAQVTERGSDLTLVQLGNTCSIVGRVRTNEIALQLGTSALQQAQIRRCQRANRL
jgi:hypothetical protein